MSVCWSTEITPTLAFVDESGPFGVPGTGWPLAVPFVNWGDGLDLLAGAVPVLRDQNYRVIGSAFIPDTTQESRVLFFPVPLEALPPAALADLLGMSTLWLGPFGGSSLLAPRLVSAGDTVSLALHMQLADRTPRSGLFATISLPLGAAIVPGSLAGDWVYLPDTHALAWAGSLDPLVPLNFSADLVIDGGVSPGTHLEIHGLLGTDDGERFAMEAEIAVDAPLLEINKQAAAASLTPAAPRGRS